MTHQREFDFVLYGVTGYTGRLALDYILTRKEPVTRWAMAGRSLSKMEALLPSDLEASRRPSAVLVVDTSASEETTLENMRAMCRRTAVLLTMAGPFAEVGELMLRACLAERTHYMDITAEMFWVEKMLRKYGDAARESGVVFVPCCGYDYSPNDLMLHQIATLVRKDHGTLTRVTHAFQQSTTMISGGTIKSGLKMLGEIPMKETIKAYTDPYQLCDKDTVSTLPKEVVSANSNFILPDKDLEHLQGYCVPFVMSALMAKYIHWSNMIQGYPWGKALVYHGGEHRYWAFTAYLYSIIIWLQYVGSMFLARLPEAVRRVLPQPGHGPAVNPKTDYMQSVLVAKATYPATKEGTVTKTHTITWRLDGREAYGYAAACAVEAAVILAYAKLPKEMSGFKSPSAVMGDELIEALERHSEVKMTINMDASLTSADATVAEAETRPTTSSAVTQRGE